MLAVIIIALNIWQKNRKKCEAKESKAGKAAAEEKVSKCSVCVCECVKVYVHGSVYEKVYALVYIDI